MGGRAIKVPLNELLSGYSRTQDYTQKTMALAEERRGLEARFEQERGNLREFLSKPENVKQLHDYLVTQQGGSDPNQPLTTQQLRAAMAAERAERSQEQARLIQDLELRQQESTYRGDIDTHIKSILEQHPELKAVRGIGTLLKQAAREAQPETIDEAKQLILRAASEHATALRSHFEQQQKTAVLNKQNLTQKGTEPPGGAAPMPTAKGAFKLNDPRLRDDVTSYLKQMMNG